MGVKIIVPDSEADSLPPIGCVIDGGGILITTGDKRAPVTVVDDCLLTGWRVVGDVPGSVVLDIYRAVGIGDYPSTTSICDSDPPTVVTSIAAESSDVSAWCGGTAELDAGDILEFSVLSVSGFKQIRIELFRKTR